MPTLRLRFPARRYHATPWGHHVNEGLVEWPPSPWRLLRALLATGYAQCNWPASGPPAVARSLIEKLACAAPRFALPDAVGTHSRHYMPMARFKNGREETTLVFDTWAQIDSGEIRVSWDVQITDDERGVLSRLADQLGYLGRSESWVEAELVETTADTVADDAFPCAERDPVRAGWEQVALLAPITATEYAQWRASAWARACMDAGVDPNKPRHSASESKKLKTIAATLPVDLVAALQVDTNWLHELGWSQPPGSRKLLYWRRSNTFESTAPRAQRSPVRATPVECMLLAIAPDGGNLQTLPGVERTLPQAELLHRALNANAARIGGHSAVLSGCDAQGERLRLPHQHAHLLHLDLDGDGHLDHVLVWAPMGLDAHAQAAIRATRKSYTKGGSGPLRLALAASGTVRDLAALSAPFGNSLLRVVGASGGTTHWRSVTPFVPPRHLKNSGRHTLAGQVTAELVARGIPEPIAVRVRDPHSDELALSARHFVRSRRRGVPPPQDCGFMLEIELAQPVPGPIAIGYGCHFGLGLLETETSR